MDTNSKKARLLKLQEKINLIFKEVDCRKIVEKALGMSPDTIIENISTSGLRGRGGAGFPAGNKWKFARQSESDMKYVLCNADEGEPGTFKDRQILDERCDKVVAGMAVCARAIGAKEGYIYLRGEYNFLIPKLNKVIDEYNAFFKAKNSVNRR